MNQRERKLADSDGSFAMAILDGAELSSVSWNTGRIIISTERLIIEQDETTHAIALDEINDVGRGDPTPHVSDVDPTCLTIHFDRDLLLLAPEDVDAFEHHLYQVLISGTSVSATGSAVPMRADEHSTPIEGRLKLTPSTVTIALTSGPLLEVELQAIVDIGSQQQPTDTQADTEVTITFTDDEQVTSLVLLGTERTMRLLTSFIEHRRSGKRPIDLGELEREILTSLYAGVDALEVPSFIGAEVDAVEAAFDRLIDAGVIDEVRVRREVELSDHGQHIASDVLSDQ